MLQYSILKYAPVTSRSTHMTLGILFHEPTLEHREFRFITNLSRLSQFESEIDVAMVEKLLQGIKEDVESKRFDKSFDIEDYTRFYLNDFCFESIETIEYDVLGEVIEGIVKTYI